MHDWVFLGLKFIWESGSCLLEFRDGASQVQVIRAHGIRKLVVPRFEEWGPSVCVNSIFGPILENGADSLKIEMQSGDVIFVEASKIDMP